MSTNQKGIKELFFTQKGKETEKEKQELFQVLSPAAAMDDKKSDLTETVTKNIIIGAADNAETVTKNFIIGAAENAWKEGSGRISASPYVQGLIVGYIAGRLLPIGLFLSVGSGFLCGLFMEENFRLPDLKESILKILPEQKNKSKDE